MRTISVFFSVFSRFYLCRFDYRFSAYLFSCGVLAPLRFFETSGCAEIFLYRKRYRREKHPRYLFYFQLSAQDGKPYQSGLFIAAVPDFQLRLRTGAHIAVRPGKILRRQCIRRRAEVPFDDDVLPAAAGQKDEGRKASPARRCRSPARNRSFGTSKSSDPRGLSRTASSGETCRAKARSSRNNQYTGYAPGPPLPPPHNATRHARDSAETAPRPVRNRGTRP